MSLTIAQSFDPKRNSLNLLRLCLAVSVIFWHAFPLGGRAASQQVASGLGGIGVDGFFAISGFLITASWLSQPQAGRFLWHRALRILPGLWACVLFTSLVAGPLISDSRAYWAAAEPLRYAVLNGALLTGSQLGINGTPTDVPYPAIWNGSLYTLTWEALCYLAVLTLGLLGVLRRRRLLVLIGFVAIWALSIGVDFLSVELPDAPYKAMRFALMFSAGMVLRLYANRIPYGRLPALAAVAALGTGLAIGHHRPIAAFAIAYLALWVAIAVDSHGFAKRRDLSYGVYLYGFVVQQVLAHFGLHRQGYVVYVAASLATTFVLAWFSFSLVERPAMRLKNRPSVLALSAHGR